MQTEAMTVEESSRRPTIVLTAEEAAHILSAADFTPISSPCSPKKQQHQQQQRQQLKDLPQWLYSAMRLMVFPNAKATRIMAFVALFTLPIFAIFVNIFFSYRLDPAGFFSKFSAYRYDSSVDVVKARESSYSGTWWTHKICSCSWTVLIIVQVLLNTLYGHIGGFHQLIGTLILVSAFLTATSGLIMETEHRLRYDNFTKYFIYIASITTYIMCFGFIIARSFNIVIFGYRVKHSYFGYSLIIPPVGMLSQVVVYSVALAMNGNKKDDYLIWRVSIVVCMFGAIAATALFTAHSYAGREEREKAGKPHNVLCELDGLDNPETMSPPAALPDVTVIVVGARRFSDIFGGGGEAKDNGDDNTAADDSHDTNRNTIWSRAARDSTLIVDNNAPDKEYHA